MRILYNAQIYTLADDHPVASALVIDDHAPNAGRVLMVGDEDAVRAEFGGRAELEDMGGKVILPGLTDAHIHLQYYGLGLQKLDCVTQSKAECLERVAARAKTTPPGEWILGHGWNQNEWRDDPLSAAELDAVAPAHPVFLTHTSLHSAAVNTLALKAAGIDARTPDPRNGSIGRDASGNPNGMLYEAADELLLNAIPTPTPAEIEAGIQAAQEQLWAYGLTGVHDFDRIPCFQALQRLRARGELKLRVIKSMPVDQIEQAVAVGLGSGFGDDLLRIGNVKVFMDGALGPHTAAMFAPYEGDPENRGMLFVDWETLLEYGQQAAQSGLGMAVHAIGDRANHEVLNAYTQLREYERAQGLPAQRHRIEHVQVLHPDDLTRLAELDVIASVQPIHATADMYAADEFWGERAALAYAFKSLLDSGTRLAFGSDAPVESPNPFWGLQAAVARRRNDGSPDVEGWRPEQKLDLLTALRGFTSGPAYTGRMEDHLGMLAPGYLADLIVLDTDPFAIPPEQLHTIRPLATMVGGDWVWHR